MKLRFGEQVSGVGCRGVGCFRLQSSVFRCARRSFQRSLGLQSSRHGFTLMELLIVIAIIGILAAMIIPTVGRMQERAREVQCVSNLRQLHTAAISFANNGNRLPRASSISIEEADGTPIRQVKGWVASVAAGVPQATGHAWWYEQGGDQGTASIVNGTLFAYAGEVTAVYVCPTMARIARSELAGERRNVTRSYGMNSRMSHQELAGIDGASRVMLFADQGFRNMGRTRFLTGADGGPSEEGEEDDDDSVVYWRRHNMRIDGSIDIGNEYIGAYHGPGAGETGADGGRANVVFVDGHTESVSYLHTDDVGDGDWEDGAPL